MKTSKSVNSEVNDDCRSQVRDGQRTVKFLFPERLFVSICSVLVTVSVLGAAVSAQVPGSHQGRGQGPGANGARSRDTQAQMASIACPKGEDLITIPEIKSVDGTLKALITVKDGKRTLWGYGADVGCQSQDIRYFAGQDLQSDQPENPAFGKKDPIPGPTLRARVGDLIEITFRNQVNPLHFAQTLDQAENQANNTTGCDEVYGTIDWAANNQYGEGFQINPAKNNPGGFVFNVQKAGTSGTTEPVFPPGKGQTVQDGSVVWINHGSGQIQIYPDSLGDAMPDCLHGSSTSNLHFHGTHTTPSTTGDNVLLFILPALRTKGRIEPDDALVKRDFSIFFKECEKTGSPASWDELKPEEWRNTQETLLKEYDKTAPFHGKPGNLPEGMKLWPVNENLLRHGLWPQYQIGAYPYCFRLPKYEPPAPEKQPKYSDGAVARHRLVPRPQTWLHGVERG